MKIHPMLLWFGVLAMRFLAGPASAEATQQAGRIPGNKGVLREVWRTGVTSSLRDFEDMGGWRRAPDESSVLPTMAFEETTEGTAVTRLAAWLEVPESGDYMFWISSQGSARLILSQPDSIQSMRTAGLLYIRDSIGWPAKGQWDLYASQRCGPWALEKGKRYFMEIWHAGKPGLKRCELAWAGSSGTGLKDWAAGVIPQAGRMVAGDGGSVADAVPGAETKSALQTWSALSPDAPVTLNKPGDAVRFDLNEEHLTQRITVFPAAGPDSHWGEPGVAWRVTAFDGAGGAVAWTILPFEGQSPPARFEWELPSLLPVAQVVVAMTGSASLKDGSGAVQPGALQAWGPQDEKSPVTARQEIDESLLNSSRQGPGDLDGNGLEDRWEEFYSFQALTRAAGSRSASHYLAAGNDEDGDGLLNQMENLAGRDPFTPEVFRHRLTADYWENVLESDVEGLVKSPAWFRKPDFRVVRWMERSSPVPQNHGLRLRGYITAPETGHYTFWIAARNAGEFWISEDQTKYRKHRVAWISPHEGTGQGISRMALNQWDQFATQRSRPVALKAGQTYYVEALAQQGTATVMGQLSLAWQIPGEKRRLLAGEALSTYLEEAEDADDDSLPDQWEKDMGLDFHDNGGTDRLRQGERGDFDGDGLTNLEEYQLGLNPAKQDSDGDGVKDGDKARSPVSGSPQDNPTHQLLILNPAAYSGSSMSWHQIDGALTAGEYRGNIEWKFETPEVGWHGYTFLLSLNGQTLDRETVRLALSVDDLRIASKDVEFQRQQPVAWDVAGPWLESGSHVLKLVIDNARVSRSLNIHGISIWQPEGPDYDRNGSPDWYASSLNAGYSVTNASPESQVSPVCLEGTAPGETQGILVNDRPVLPLGDSKWFANVALEPGLNGITTQFPGRPERYDSVIWRATNVLNDAQLYLRAGDSLLLAAWDTKGTPVTAYCRTAAGETFSVQHGKPYCFPEPGTFTVTGEGSGLKGRLIVEVAAAQLPPEIPVIRNLPRMLELPHGQITGKVSFEGTDGVEAAFAEDILTLFPRTSGRKAVTARLFPGGPILAACQVPVVTVTGAVAQSATLSSPGGAPSGYVRLLSPLHVSGLPEGATVEILILRSGVMFSDGSVTTVLRKEDFKDGLAWVEFFFPENASGGYCHYLIIRDRTGAEIGRF